MADSSRSVQIVDSHTGGEPTRVVIAGGPPLPEDLPIAERLTLLRDCYDDFRASVILEPRGSDIVVGALVCEPVDRRCAAGVIFFNNVGYLGMCGHGTIGLLVTLHHLGRVGLGTHALETAVGIVSARIEGRNRVAVKNVPSFRYASAVRVTVEGLGEVVGDVAWGGNWFFLVRDHQEEVTSANVERLTDVCWRIRHALQKAGIAGADGQQVDHIELFGPSKVANSRNFVLCPGKAYDRSPCGTGTSAKLACLIADGKLRPGEIYRQESIVGSVFEGSVEMAGESIVPSITGEAYITAETRLIFQESDPFARGIQPKR